MNIGIDIRPLMCPNRTGVGQYTFELLDALFFTDKENQYYLFYNSYKDLASIVPNWSQKNVHIIKTGWPNKIFSFALALGIIKLDNIIIKNKKNSVPHLHYFFSPNLGFTSVSKKTKQILTVHDLSFKFFPDCFSWKRRIRHVLIRPKKQSQKADIILTPSKNTKKDIVTGFCIDENKIKVIYPGVNITKTTDNNKQIIKKYNLPPKFILYLGTLEPRKNILGVVEAYKKSLLIEKGYSLVIAGKIGWNYAKIISAINSTPGVKYIEYVHESDKTTIYTLSSLFVFPSLYEGFGLPVLEAMSKGVPVITSNRSSLPEVTGRAAYLVNPMNITEISLGMAHILSHHTIRKSLIEKGKNRAQIYSWQNAAKTFLSLL